MKFKYKFVLVLAVIYSISTNVFSQNVPYMHFKMLKNDTLHFYLKSNAIAPIEIVPASYGTIDNVLPGSGSTNPLTFHLKYIPDPNFTGTDVAVLEYRGNPGSSLMDWSIKKVKVEIDILNSVLNANKDVVFIQTNSPGDTIDVLANDSTTADSLFIDDVLNVFNGTATVTNDNKIIYKPDSNFTGYTFFNYKVKDDKGSGEIGHVMIYINDDNTMQDTLYYFVSNTQKLPIDLFEQGFQLDSNFLPQLGTLDFSNDPELIYTPDVEQTGTDIFHLNNTTDSIVISVEIFEGKDNGNIIVDDVFFTGLNTDISFNVTGNDYNQNTFSLSHTNTDHGTLTYTGNGNFTYSPDNGFNGIDEFTYTVQLSFFYFQTANVKIFVDNYYPSNISSYKINVSQNSQFVLNYKIPIDGYWFNLHAAPLEGAVDIYPGYDTVYVNCEDVAGNNLIVYTPPQGYVGSDRFEIEYCPPNDSCEIIKIDVNVLEEVSDSSCACAANSCIWPGDTDNNGKVNAKDILPIGFYLGQTGPSRDFSTVNWLGLNAEEWSNNQMDNGYNLNHVDADGNGIINTDDTISVLAYYNKTHNLYPAHTVQQNEFPLYLETDQTSVDSGEVLTLYIIAGDDDYPVKEINGISYNLSLQSYFVDSASLHHEFYTNSWLTNGGTSVQISKQVQDGQVETALSRIGFPNVSGIGKIATCDFIVEDDLDGLKRTYGMQTIPITIKLTDIVAMRADGTTINLQNTKTTVMLNIDSKNIQPYNNNLNIYPNPAKHEVNISLVGNENISGYTIYNSLGMIKENKLINHGNNIRIDLNSYINGVYFIKIYTDNKKTYTKKIEILN